MNDLVRHLETGCVIEQLKVRYLFFRNYAYIIVDKTSRQTAIVDPAWELRTITERLEKLDVRLTTILLTHSHYDHVNLVNPLVDRFGAQVYMSAREIDYYHFTSKNLHSVQDQDVITLGESGITCLLTPGHTAGGICYFSAGSLFTGDTIFTEGCGICNGEGGSPEEMFETIQKIKNTVHPGVRVYPGHSYGKDPGYTLAHLMKENIYFLINKKNYFVDFRMRENQPDFFRFH